eukprot:CAMPEP_0179145316 /NCGR_PEP_ID=MMETSP0796-20121207/70092_1 /TAXON_ID=73915 /ORGANISM="Pyrodinium bahamense, Strain pbaha01" /LENGTH=142 /DNA_ID=CAMNT_0020845673 /DNA_START=172 /DNA_END=598 /DNA_ORIENTATION=+
MLSAVALHPTHPGFAAKTTPRSPPPLPGSWTASGSPRLSLPVGTQHRDTQAPVVPAAQQTDALDAADLGINAPLSALQPHAGGVEGPDFQQPLEVPEVRCPEHPRLHEAWQAASAPEAGPGAAAAMASAAAAAAAAAPAPRP